MVSNSIKAGSNKAAMPKQKLFIRAIFAGIFIAFGAIGSQVISLLTGSSYTGAFIFPVGLILVISTGSELFTGDCLMVTAYADKKINLKQLLSTWGIVYVGNLFGSLIMAALICCCGLTSISNDDAFLSDLMVKAAAAKTVMPVSDLFIRGILCNFLVCTAVIIAGKAETLPGKALAAYLPVMLFVLCRFEHSIANMYFIPVGILLDNVSISGFLYNLFFVTLGNIIGGVAVGYGLYKAQTN